MNARSILTFLALIFAALLGGCAAPQPSLGGDSGSYGYRTGAFPMPPGPHVPAGWANAYTPYDTVHNGRCYRNGFVQPTLDACRGMAATQSQVLGTTRTIGAQAPAIAGISPETARMLLDEFARRENPCAAKERTIMVSIGAFIGGAAAAVLTGDLRWAAAGALVGALGGNSEAVMSCQAYTDTRLALLAVLDQYGCSGQVRKTNGVVTDDEICNFRRSYTPGHRPPQIADREVIRPAAVPVARPVPPPPKPRPAPKPRVELEEELPPK